MDKLIEKIVYAKRLGSRKTLKRFKYLVKELENVKDWSVNIEKTKARFNNQQDLKSIVEYDIHMQSFYKRFHFDLNNIFSWIESQGSWEKFNDTFRLIVYKDKECLGSFSNYLITDFGNGLKNRLGLADIATINSYTEFDSPEYFC